MNFKSRVLIVEGLTSWLPDLSLSIYNLTQLQHPAHLGINNRKTTKKFQYLWIYSRPGQFIQDRGDVRPGFKQLCKWFHLPALDYTFILRSAVWARKRHARRVVWGWMKGWEGGRGGGMIFRALWLDSSRWRVLGAGPRWKEGSRWLHGLSKGTGNHAHGFCCHFHNVFSQRAVGYIRVIKRTF